MTPRLALSVCSATPHFRRPYYYIVNHCKNVTYGHGDANNIQPRRVKETEKIQIGIA